MKRSDLKVGEYYALQSPSQRGKENGRFGGNSARKVLVVDTKPEWAGSYNDTRYQWRRTTKPGSVILIGNVKLEYADNVTYHVGRDGKGRVDEKAKRNVLVVEFGHYGGPILSTVPIANISMTWADFEARVAAADVRRRMEDKAEAVDRARHERQREVIRDIIEKRNVQGSIRMSSWGSDATMSLDTLEALLRRL